MRLVQVLRLVRTGERWSICAVMRYSYGLGRLVSRTRPHQTLFMLLKLVVTALPQRSLVESR